MHIAEGVLGWEALSLGWGVSAVGVGYGLWRMDYDRIPRVAALSSAFFVASLIHVQHFHLLLNGLAGLILGWAAFPALIIALFLQALFFQFGGLTTLGVNTMTMALPAVLCYYLFHGLAARGSPKVAAVAGFAAGALAILLAWAFWAACIITAGSSLKPVTLPTLLLHLPLMIIEGFLTMSAVSFLRMVRPELIEAPMLRKDES